MDETCPHTLWVRRMLIVDEQVAQQQQLQSEPRQTRLAGNWHPVDQQSDHSV